MLEFIQLYSAQIIGIIWMLVLGPAVGNYACSVVYRLPRGQTPFERSPFCGHCDAPLLPIDLFPIISWMRTRGKCRYCGGAIPSIYTVIEFTCGAIFIAYFLHFGISEPFLIYTAYAVFVVILAAIHFQQGWISATICSYALGLVVLARTLAESSIYGPLKGAFLMLVLMLVLMRIAREKASPFTKPWVWWFVLLGALVPMAHWVWLCPIYAAKLLVPKPGRVVVYGVAALVLPVLVA